MRRVSYRLRLVFDKGNGRFSTARKKIVNDFPCQISDNSVIANPITGTHGKGIQQIKMSPDRQELAEAPKMWDDHRSGAVIAIDDTKATSHDGRSQISGTYVGYY